MITTDEYKYYDIHMFSANGVPYPHDEWLALQGKMTTWQAAELVKRWGKNDKQT